MYDPNRPPDEVVSSGGLTSCFEACPHCKFTSCSESVYLVPITCSPSINNRIFLVIEQDYKNALCSKSDNIRAFDRF